MTQAHPESTKERSTSAASTAPAASAASAASAVPTTPAAASERVATRRHRVWRTYWQTHGQSWRRHPIRKAFGLTVVVAVLGGLVWAWIPDPPVVEVAGVWQGPISVTVDEDGRTRVRDRYSVVAPITGTLARIELDPGDEVRPGQPLFSMMPVAPALLDIRSRQSAEVQLRSALAVQRQTSAQLERAQAQARYASDQAARVRQLYQQGGVPRDQYDRAMLQERSAQAELDSARFALQVAQHQVQMAQVALKGVGGVPAGASGPRGEGTAGGTRSGQGKAAEQLDVSAPVRGRVLKVLQREGVIQAGTPLLELGDPAALEVVVDVLTSDAVQIPNEAAVTVDGWGGRTLAGRVRRVEPSAFTRISALGVEEQRVNVIVDLTSARRDWASLGDGYRVDVHIVTWRSDRALQVPPGALFRHGEGWAVFVRKENRAVLRQVRVGPRTARAVVIERGLRPTDIVIVHPSDRIRPGVKVAAP
jgi:HlyD family secretion protein